MSEMFDFKNYQWRKMANNGEKWRKMAMANLPFKFVKFAISPLAPPPPPVAKRKACLQPEKTHGYQYFLPCNSLILISMRAGSLRTIKGV